MSSRPLGKEPLQAWLAPPDQQSVSGSELRLLLDANAGAIPPESGKAMFFALALLKDMYADDADVRLWLTRQRREFDGLAAADLLRCGRAHEVETLLVRLWNLRTQLRPRRPTYPRRTFTT